MLDIGAFWRNCTIKASTKQENVTPFMLDLSSGGNLRQPRALRLAFAPPATSMGTNLASAGRHIRTKLFHRPILPPSFAFDFPFLLVFLVFRL